ncbi:MAG: type 1 glutamine amidotransferase [Salinibacter sp.]|uniref:type 1 glutamine amidotransferase n=1 Tax=Salinibacter sp. TaxID=2065818 RepID=UPI002FC39C14
MVNSPLTSSSICVLLVQCRSAPRMETQEQTCFLERTRLHRDQLHTVNVARGDDPASVSLDAVDAFLIGGAGKYSATQTYPWTEGLHGLVRRAVDRGLPTLGSCWGHQVLARALGGRVVHDPDHSELGCGWVELTEAGANDPLFCQFSSRFQANMGHHDRVIKLPPGTTELARNDQPHQAFRLDDAPVYGTQFHSELDAKRERERILVYREYYRSALPDAETVQRVLDTLADTTEVDNLLYDFLTTFVARPHPSAAPTTLLPLDGIGTPGLAPVAARPRSSPRSA